MLLTRPAMAAKIRAAARRLQALGADIKEPETLNDSPADVLALVEALIVLAERSATKSK